MKNRSKRGLFNVGQQDDFRVFFNSKHDLFIKDEGMELILDRLTLGDTFWRCEIVQQIKYGTFGSWFGDKSSTNDVFNYRLMKIIKIQIIRSKIVQPNTTVSYNSGLLGRPRENSATWSKFTVGATSGKTWKKLICWFPGRTRLFYTLTAAWLWNWEKTPFFNSRNPIAPPANSHTSVK